MTPQDNRTTPQARPHLFSFNAGGSDIAITATEKDGQAWFVAADVCRALGIKNHRDALARLEDDEKGVGNSDTLGGRQQVATVNESGLYSLIFRSNKDQARTFRRWVTSVVIPAIRKHGGYINGMEAVSTEEQAQALQVIHKEAARLGLCAKEEREARADTLRFLRRGRA